MYSSGISLKSIALFMAAKILLSSSVSCMNTNTSGHNDRGAEDTPNKSRRQSATSKGPTDKEAQKVLGGNASQSASLNKDVLSELPTGEDQFKILCARGGSDRVREVFCSPDRPKITGLKDLQQALGLSPSGSGNILTNLLNGGSGFVFTGHSSSLVGKFTSASNPRLIMFDNSNSHVALGFVRGEQFAEIVAEDRKTRQFKFFLVRFTQECNESGPDGIGKQECSNAHLLSPAIESDWKSITIYEDVDVENTIFDCLQCHQPAGVGSPKILRMQELTNPWTHFMRDNTTGGRALLADFEKVHGGDDFAGVPANRIRDSDPARLENFVRGAGHGNQPNEFPSRAVEIESGIFGNSRPSTWAALYDRFVKGEAIAPPYHKVKVYDQAKLDQVAKQYKQFRSGNLDEKDFPDTRDVLLTSGLRDMGFMVKDGLDSQGILINACAQCHNSKLNQNISRAKFDVDLSKMSQEEKTLAVERINLPDDDPKKMPPVRFRVLTEEEIKKLEGHLSK